MPGFITLAETWIVALHPCMRACTLHGHLQLAAMQAKPAITLVATNKASQSSRDSLTAASLPSRRSSSSSPLAGMHAIAAEWPRV